MLAYLYCFDPLPKHLANLEQACNLQRIAEGDLKTIGADQLVLVYDQQGLQLGNLKNGKINSRLIIDFASPEFQYRKKSGKLSGSGLAKAIFSNSNKQLTVVDATTGLGYDTFDLICLGCRVIACERNPIIYHLLLDALNRAQSNPELNSFCDSITLLNQNVLQSADFLKLQKPDVIYLDPMFPERNKSALVKKESRWLREIVGADTDADQLLQFAREHARLKVVVKRPKSAVVLDALSPHHSIVGKTVRYDVYLALAGNFSQ